MARLKLWIEAARPRTLPLALAGLIMGNLLAYNYETFSWPIFNFSILTAALLQILSNYANDYGDFKNGADNENRIGPKRAVQSGGITEKQMFKAILFFASLSLISGVWLLYLASETVNVLWLLVMLLFGLASIGAAYKYTASKNPYGYKGMGDIAVFLFFGLLAVLGSFFLQTNAFSPIVLLPACAFGLLSTAVLNLNNMRDIENDANSGKITIAVRLGIKNAKNYHYTLISIATISFLIFCFTEYAMWYQFLFLIPLLLLYVHFTKVKKRSTYAEFDPLLKELALSSALIAICISIAYIL
ncbi:MAG: 1,4-dihydroxy-2-naphthoate polyprenyltransferase [Bacteroidia bacterium]